ncbi:hypothetical protein BJX68DRAFT_268081 [Aspergillus pseudodeflectus]|uniref:Uncharacterized protein n=1 Tax=Aspergillus pseudodeflectus TaxID=176178 RepID=A0ABR4K5V6_9EURO
MESSLLGYARFHGIASSFLEIDPFDHVDFSHIALRDDTLPEAVQSECLNRLNDARVSLEQSLYQDKLHVSQRAGRLLSSIVRESQAKSPSINWKEVFPAFRRIDDIKLNAPIFPMEDKRKTQRYTSHDIKLQVLKEPFKTDSTDATSFMTSINADDFSLLEKIREEKLVCTRDSVALMQHARVSGETPVKELEEELGRLMEISRKDIGKPLPPLLVPLCPGYFPPSPALVSDEHMLPSPVASELVDMDIDTDLDRFRPRLKMSGVEDPVLSDNESPGVVAETSTAMVAAPCDNLWPSPKGRSLSNTAACQPSALPQSLTSTSRKELVSQKRRSDRNLRFGQQRSRPPVPRGNLGSLASFMETRGKVTRDKAPAESSYSISQKESEQAAHENISNVTTSCMVAPLQKGNLPQKKPNIQPGRWQETPEIQNQYGGLVLFISTALLKTHLKVLQHIEQKERPPKVIYRDYAPVPTPKNQQKYRSIQFTSHSQPQYQRSALYPPPEEADIVLSAKTGIMLTTTQAAMQQYLPGHKPTSIPLNCPKSVNSPLRERIFRLSSRYEQLYIFLSHGAKQSKSPKLRALGLQISADKYLLSSLTTLTAFCTSLSKHATIVPLIVPSDPEKIAGWILGFAHKYACQLPPPRSHSQYTNAFTPVNPKPQLELWLGDVKESVWELFLRRMGLNPFAAQVILAILRRENEADNSTHENRASCLSRFVEMSSEERKALFWGLLGGSVLGRVESIIEKDWQCDWALDFERMVE